MSVRRVVLEEVGSGAALLESLRDTGFAVVKTEEITSDMIEKAYAEWRPFFASNSVKFDNLFDSRTQAGYFPFKSENAKDHPTKDLKEFYHLFYPFLQVPNKDRERFENTFILANKLNEIASKLLSILDKELPSHIFGRLSQDLGDMSYQSTGTLFRILHYPPLTGDHEPGAVRAAAHEDINLITLLPSATAPGLEVKDNEGNWHAVVSQPGDIVINAGDMLQEATGGHIKSTTHRVVNPTDGSEKNSRYSMPLFVHPTSDVRLSEKYTAGEYLNERLREIGLIK